MIRTYNDIPGWFDFHDIYDRAVEMAEDGDVMVEVGCFLGKSAFYLGQKLKEKGVISWVIAVDLFEPQGEEHQEIIAITGQPMLNQFIQNGTDLNLLNYVVPLQRDSITAAGLFEPVKMAFLDADHGYEAVCKDLEAWWPLVKSGGMFAGHDYGEETAGVKQAVDEFCVRHGVTMERSKASWIIMKP